MPEYVVKITAIPAAADAKSVTTERLVSAKTKAGAINHVAASTITADLATIQDAMRLAKLDVELETAGE